MAIRLNRRAYDHARMLIAAGRYEFDERDSWSEHRPTAAQENSFIAAHGFAEYARWYLGIDDERPADTKARYTFPYSDFERVHRCAVLSAEVRAAQYKHQDIESAVAHLHGAIDALARS
jgi:hypothetical protein